jgi:hypothetical protein
MYLLPGIKREWYVCKYISSLDLTLIVYDNNQIIKKAFFKYFCFLMCNKVEIYSTVSRYLLYFGGNENGDLSALL